MAVNLSLSRSGHRWGVASPRSWTNSPHQEPWLSDPTNGNLAEVLNQPSTWQGLQRNGTIRGALRWWWPA